MRSKMVRSVRTRRAHDRSDTNRIHGGIVAQSVIAKVQLTAGSRRENGIFQAKSPIKGRRLSVLGIIEKPPARSENVDWLTGLLTQDPLGPQLHHVMIHGDMRHW